MKTIRDVMTREVITVTKQDNLYEIAVKMRDHNIGFVPVVEGNQAIGCVTDRDLVIRGYAEKHSGSTAVETAMSQPCITVSPDTSVQEAADLMAENKIRRLIVEENGQMTGVVAIGDLAVRQNLQQEAGAALSDISEPTQEQASFH